MELVETKELLLCKPPLTRKPGLHVSDIIRDLVDTLEGHNRGKDETVPDDVKAKWEMGFALEAALEEGYKRDATACDLGARPGEIEYEGVWGSPDGVAVIIGEDPDGSHYAKDYILEEIKCTWMSSRKTRPHDIMRYRMQVLAYCKMLSEKYGMPVRTVRFWCFYINGDYTYPLKPQALRYTYRVTTQQVEENWAMLSAHRRRMEAKNE
jgi:hypothetical protein